MDKADFLECATQLPAIEPNVHHPHAVTVGKLRILHDYLVVTPLAVPAKEHGGSIILADTVQSRERSHRGIVIVCGAGDWNDAGTDRIPMSVKAGDLVFFGKYAGTEEAIGGERVLVMREAECRLSVPFGGYEVVRHEDHKLDHLVEDWCEVCHGIPLEEAAKERLALEREQLLVGKQPGADGADVSPAMAEAETILRELTLAEANDIAVSLMKNDHLAQAFPLPVIAVFNDKRPCAGSDDARCRFMQRKLRGGDDTEVWLGLRCGHWHRALVTE